MRVMRTTLRAARTAWVPGVLWLSACGPSPIHVNGVMRESSEMRPLRNLPPGAYGQLRVLVRSASEPGQQGEAPECGATPLEGAEDHNNAACVPSDASNAAVKLVRQRLRSYGLTLAREEREPHDYDVQVLVVGVAPKRPDPMAARAVAKVTFKRSDAQGTGGFFAAIDEKAAADAFDVVAKDCALQDSDLADFSAAAAQPMTPDFDIAALTSDAVDNLVGCAELARFFVDVKNHYPHAAVAAPAPAAPQPATP
jgi:hypothetical protein